MVWTGDGRVFFFNPSTKTSLWEKPKELEENFTIDELLKLGPPSATDKETPEPMLVDIKKEEPLVTRKSLLFCRSTTHASTFYIHHCSYYNLKG